MGAGIDASDSETYSLYLELKKDGVIVPEDLEVAVLARRVVHDFLRLIMEESSNPLPAKLLTLLRDDPVSPVYWCT